MRKQLLAIGLSILMVSALPLSAFAGILHFASSIDGAQANNGAGTGSLATGTATATLDTDTLLFSWEIEWTPLASGEIAAHFHGPAAPGMGAGVQLGFGTTNPNIGSATVTATQAQQLADELWYINIHSNDFTGGEIRGQVLRAPQTPALPTWGAWVLMACFLAAATIVLARRRRAVVRA